MTKNGIMIRGSILERFEGRNIFHFSAATRFLSWVFLPSHKGNSNVFRIHNATYAATKKMTSRLCVEVSVNGSRWKQHGTKLQITIISVIGPSGGGFVAYCHRRRWWTGIFRDPDPERKFISTPLIYIHKDRKEEERDQGSRGRCL